MPWAKVVRLKMPATTPYYTKAKQDDEKELRSTQKPKGPDCEL